MCGIIGVANSRTRNATDLVSTGIGSLKHRGPDAKGIWTSKDGSVCFGHTRLSIIDLSSQANQPLISPLTESVICFNGEIYNYIDLRYNLAKLGHEFKTSSDTEVLLASYDEWGVNCVKHLNGMFSFAIFDPRKGIIFAARDRSGEKPFFYSLQDGFRFCSELKGLLSDPNLDRKIDHLAVNCFMEIGYVPGGQCIIDNFHKLPPGHYITYDLATSVAHVSRYWNLPQPSLSHEFQNQTDLAAKLTSLLSRSVSKQFCADVPIGILLSGGLDSSVVAALAARTGNSVHTYSVGFPGAMSFDETMYARSVSKHIGSFHHEFMANDVSPELIYKLATQFDEPIVDSSMIPTFLVCELVKNQCKVVLGGDGADELFGGYKHYHRLELMQKLLGWIPLGFRKTISQLFSQALPIGFRGRNWAQSLKYDFRSHVPLLNNKFDLQARIRMFKHQISNAISIEDLLEKRQPTSGKIATRAMQFDFQNYMVEDILVKVDRSSMLNSIEVRSPFLDKDIVEFAFSEVPLHLKTHGNNRKILLANVARELLPKNFNFTRKQGFSIPLDDWLKTGPLRTYFMDILLDQGSLFDTNFINSLFSGLDKGYKNGERIFALCIFEIWRKKYEISF